MNENIKILFRFLKENGVYKNYLNELIKYHKGVNGARAFLERSKNKQPFILIDNSFLWADTKIGHEKWHNLSHEFSLYYSKWRKKSSSDF